MQIDPLKVIRNALLSYFFFLNSINFLKCACVLLITCCSSQQEGIMPADKKAKFLSPEASEFEKVIDFYVCSQSEVFVPAISGLFYANVAGKRIASGKTQILVPAYIPGSSASANDFVSRYVSEKNHLAYSCFC